MNIINVDFNPLFRAELVQSIKHYGVDRVTHSMQVMGWHPTFVSVMVKSIMGREGW